VAGGTGSRPPPRLASRTVAAAAAVLLVSVVGFLLVSHGRSARTLRENFLRLRVQQVQLRAASVAHLLSSAQEDLRNLAEAREVAAFHENQDLGMSLEYGLTLSLVPIRERLVRLTTHPRRGTQPTFSRVAMLDADGAVLADSSAAAVPSGQHLAGLEQPGEVLLSEEGRELQVVLRSRFKGRPVGWLIGWLRPGPIQEALSPITDPGTARLLDRRGRVWSEAEPALAVAGWPELSALPASGRMIELRPPRGEAMLAVRVEVPGQPFSVLQLDRAEALLGGLTPLQSVLSLSTAVLLVLGGALVALFLNTKALVLRTRLEESILREAEVAEKNQALWREVEERHRVERSRALLARAVDQVGEAIAVTDAGGRFVYVNPAFEQITGWAAAEICGRNVLEAAPGLYEGAAGASLRAALGQRQAWKGELPLRRRDGTLLSLELVVSPVHDVEGRTVSFVTAARDVTEERRLLEQLRHSQRLEAVGKLAGGVAHDFNNLLSVINGYAAAARDELSADHPLREDLDDILRAGKRAADLVRQLLAFGRRQPMALEVVDLDAAVTDIDKMLRRLIREDVELVNAPGAATPWVSLEPGQLEQVLVNLVVNARDAMPRGGRITVSTASVQLSEQEAKALLEGRPGAWVRLRVEDTGVGIDPDTLGHIFEPYFTTKEFGKGTGLGLAVIYGIVRRCRGFIHVASRVGAGSTFDIYLPPAGAPPARAQAPPDRPPDGSAGRPGETVLVVEDEPQLLELLRSRLALQGFVVLAAADGRQALEVAERHPGRIDVLLSDVVMPRLGGPALAERFRSLRPEGLVVLMSGYAEDDDGQLRGADAFVQKPHGLESLPCLLRKLLDAGRPARAT
jgi:PAS domain S-box-containing protein